MHVPVACKENMRGRRAGKGFDFAGEERSRSPLRFSTHEQGQAAKWADEDPELPPHHFYRRPVLFSKTSSVPWPYDMVFHARDIGIAALRQRRIIYHHL